MTSGARSTKGAPASSGMAEHVRTRGSGRVRRGVSRPGGAGHAAYVQHPEPRGQRVLGVARRRLSDFGRDVIDEMNRCGVLVDLSHVGPKTSADAVRHSAKPVAYTIAARPGSRSTRATSPTPRCGRWWTEAASSASRPIRRSSPGATRPRWDQCVEVFEYVIDVAGEDAVGIGTDFTQDQDLSFFEWLRSDKGHGRLLVPGAAAGPASPQCLATIKEFPI